MVIAIDIGGTYIKIGIVNNGEIVGNTKIKAFPELDFQETMSAIEKAINSLLQSCTVNKNAIEGIGIGFPGLVDSESMKVISTNQKYNSACGYDFNKWSKNAFHVKVFLENDARVALLGEWQYGAGKGFNDIVMLTLGTGVGSATLINGKLLIGKHFQAGNMGGHFTVNINGSLCTCGNLGCVEAEASTWRLAEILQSDPRFEKSMIKGNELDFESVFKYAEKGGQLSRDIRNYCLEVWSAAVINQIHAYDPEIVIIGGGITKSADVIIPFIVNKVNKHAWTPWGNVKIIPSEIPNRSAILGAYYLVKKNLEN